MCWFHLKVNIRKHKNLIPQDRYLTTLNEINVLDRATCESSYKFTLLKQIHTIHTIEIDITKMDENSCNY